MAEEIKEQVAAPVTEPVSAQPPAAQGESGDTVRAQIDALATSYGYNPSDFAGFKDADSATAAIKLAIESNVSRTVNLPADRFSKPAATQQETTQSAPTYQPIDYKALGLEDDDAVTKVLRLRDKQLKETDDRIAAMEKRYAEQREEATAREERGLMQQADEIISGFASPRYGTASHRTRVQEMQVNKLIEMAGVIRQNSGHTLPMKACLNQARLLDEGTAAAVTSTLPPKKPANAELSQGGSPALSEGIKKMTMTEQWSTNPELRARAGLPPLARFA